MLRTVAVPSVIDAARFINIHVYAYDEQLEIGITNCRTVCLRTVFLDKIDELVTQPLDNDNITRHVMPYLNDNLEVLILLQ